MLRFVFFFLFLIYSTLVFLSAQDSPEKYLDVRGIAEYEAGPLARASVILYEGNTKIKTVQTGSDGIFSFRLEVNRQYNIEVAKEGLISKSISFNTQMPSDEKGTWMNEFSIGLIKPCQGIDYSLLKQPVDRISFDAKRREFVSDKDYSSSMRPRIEALMIKSDQCQMQTYDDLIKKADLAVKQNNLQEALKSYKDALSIYPDEDYPQKRIAEINNQVQKQHVSAEVYRGLVTEADALADQGRLAEAVQKYEKASSLNPSEAYPKQKIKELKTSLEQQQATRTAQQLKDDKYNHVMAKASVAYTKKEYSLARQYYQEALEIKPEESLPKTRVQEIQVIEEKKASEEAARAEEIAKKAAFDKEYLEVVAHADQLFKEKKFEESKLLYSKAMTMKPSESYPAQRVKVITATVAAEQASIIKAAENGYNDAMTAANNAIAKNQFELAKQSYQKALTYKTDDLQARKGIVEAERLASEFEQHKKQDELYTQNITSGDAYVNQKKWTEAVQMYNNALSIKPDDKYAQTRITFIKNSVAAEEALRLKAIDDEYKAAIASAGKAITQKQYDEAKEFLQLALKVKPGDNYAIGKIAEIDRTVQENKEKTEQEQNLARQYQEIINTADNSFNDKDYLIAKNYYSSALKLKPGDQYALQKISTIDNLMVAEQETKIKQINNSYGDAMNQGNTAILSKDYQTAREAFQKALNIKPNDNNAKLKITEVDLLVKQEHEKQLVAQNRQAKYENAITTADRYFDQKDYVSAKAYFQQAIDIKPEEAYPRQKYNESAKEIEKQEKLLSEIKVRDNAYSQALINADKYYKAKDLQQARDEYARAAALKPDETFPQTKITEIENLIAIRDKELADAISRADGYTAAINVANRAFAGKKYSEARESYSTALKYMPGDVLANDQIKKIDYLIAEAEKIRKNEEAKKTAIEALVKTADNLFDQAQYSESKTNYKKAQTLDPLNAYIKQRIARIDEINRLLSQTPAKNNKQQAVPTSKIVAAIPMGELHFNNESDRQLYLNELVKKYPPGITLEKYTEKYKEIYRYIVIRNNEAHEFRHILFTTYNGSQYSVNGKPITLLYFNSQTKVREGESFKEIVMQ